MNKKEWDNYTDSLYCNGFRMTFAHKDEKDIVEVRPKGSNIIMEVYEKPTTSEDWNKIEIRKAKVVDWSN